MSTKLPLEVLSATWTATSSSSAGTNLTNTVSLAANSVYLIITNIPNTTSSSGTYLQIRLSHNTSGTIRTVHKTRGIACWYVATSSATTTRVQSSSSTSLTYADISYAGLYAIKLRDNIMPENDRTGVLLPIDIQTNTWKATSSSATNVQLTNSVTLQAGHTYLILVNTPTTTFTTNPRSIGLYNLTDKT